LPGRAVREVRKSGIVHLPCAPASVALARKALSDELRAAGVFDHAVADAALVISELLSNAILHAYPLPGERLQVAWDVNASSVEVAVSDGGSPTVPHAAHPSPSSISGRGLSIVEHLCKTWGVRTDDVGLTVWAVLAAPRSNGAGRGTDVPAMFKLSESPQPHEPAPHGEPLHPGEAAPAGGPGSWGPADAVAGSGHMSSEVRAVGDW
jgi:anti-sigma regulatory factor (Ser/Thr protein kinase)